MSAAAFGRTRPAKDWPPTIQRYGHKFALEAALTAALLDAGGTFVPLPPGDKSAPPIGTTGKGACIRLPPEMRAGLLLDASEDANLALLLGRDRIERSDGTWAGVMVIDEDNKPARGTKAAQNGRTTIAALEDRLGPLPRTLTSLTPGLGKHRLFWLAEGLEDLSPNCIKREFGAAAGVDILTEGRYIVYPGSQLTPEIAELKGYVPGEYRWEDAQAPIAHLPPAWVAYLLEQNTKREANGASNGSTARVEPVPITNRDSPYAQSRIRKATEYLQNRAPLSIKGNGGRTTMFGVCCYLVRTLRLPIDIAADLLEAHYNPRLEAAGTATWSRDARGPHGGCIIERLEKARDTASEVPPGDVETEEEWARLKAAKAALKAARAVDSNVLGFAVGDWDLGRGDSVEIAEALCNRIATTGRKLVFTEGAFYVYDASLGIWRSDEVEACLREAVWSMAGTPLPRKGGTAPLRLMAPHVRQALETLGHMVEDKRFFESAVSGLACPNGFLRLTDEGVELKPHAPEHRARAPYPTEYDPDATSEAWNAFLLALFEGDEDRDDKIQCLGEFFGGALFGLATAYQKCVAAPGEGSNGKSTLIDAVSGCFPSGTVIAFAPQSLEKEYWRSRLPGALLNAVAELPSAAVLATESFKGIVTGDMIDAREPTKPVITFRPRAGHFFGANKLPGTNDQSFGFWRRFLVIGFNRRFEETGAERAERNLAVRLLETARGAILAWLVEGAVRLQRNKRYTVPKSHTELLKSWQTGTDSVAMWLEAATRQPSEKEGGTKPRVLYIHYRHWAMQGGYKPVAENQFGQRLVKAGYDKVGKDKLYRLMA